MTMAAVPGSLFDPQHENQASAPINQKFPASDAAAMSMPEIQPAEAGPTPEIQPAEAMSMPGIQPAEADPMPETQPAEAMLMPEIQPAEAMSMPEIQPAEAAPTPEIQPAEAIPAPATDLPVLTELPPMPSNEQPLVLGDDLRQLNIVSPGGGKEVSFLKRLFSHKKQKEAQDVAPTLGVTPGAVKSLGLPTGAAASAAAAQPVSAVGYPGLVREEIMLFAGSNSRTYADAWESYRDSGEKLLTSWSTTAFLLSIVWLAYRKLYVYAFACFVLVSGLTLWEPVFALAGLAICMAGIGLFGKSLYVRFADSRVKQIIASATDPDSYVQNLRLNGGVSGPAAFAVGTLTVFVITGNIVPHLL